MLQQIFVALQLIKLLLLKMIVYDLIVIGVTKFREAGVYALVSLAFTAL